MFMFMIYSPIYMSSMINDWFSYPMIFFVIYDYWLMINDWFSYLMPFFVFNNISKTLKALKDLIVEQTLMNIYFLFGGGGVKISLYQLSN